MNERFRALALQAGEYANSVYVPPVRSKTPGKIWEDGHVDWHDLFNGKFAELIIQECTALTLDHRNADYYQGWLDYRDEIRQHWGIER
jgi:hypothetical protein